MGCCVVVECTLSCFTMHSCLVQYHWILVTVVSLPCHYCNKCNNVISKGKDTLGTCHTQSHFKFIAIVILAVQMHDVNGSSCCTHILTLGDIDWSVDDHAWFAVSFPLERNNIAKTLSQVHYFPITWQCFCILARIFLHHFAIRYSLFRWCPVGGDSHTLVPLQLTPVFSPAAFWCINNTG